jgi:hypothetical protein
MRSAVIFLVAIVCILLNFAVVANFIELAKELEQNCTFHFSLTITPNLTF